MAADDGDDGGQRAEPPFGVVAGAAGDDGHRRLGLARQPGERGGGGGEDGGRVAVGDERRDRAVEVHRHQQRGAHRLTPTARALHFEHGAVTPHRGIDGARRDESRKTRRRRERRPQRAPDGAIRQHVADRIETEISGDEACEAEAAGIGDVDGADRRALGLHRRPHIEAFEHGARTVADGGRALIETRLCGRIGREALDERDGESGVSQRHGKARADHAAAHDRNIDGQGRAHAASIRASISAACFGTPSVSTSQPLFVTTTSSSMRTPMPRSRLGAPRVPAGM